MVSLTLKMEIDTRFFYKEKFGEILASNGGRILCLHDELTSFFQATNLLSLGKKTSSDSNQSEFLTLFNCGPKRRETSNLKAYFKMLILLK